MQRSWVSGMGGRGGRTPVAWPHEHLDSRFGKKCGFSCYRHSLRALQRGPRSMDRFAARRGGDRADAKS